MLLKMRTLTAENAKDGMTISIPHSPGNHYRLVEQDGRKYVVPIGSAAEAGAYRLFLEGSDRGDWKIVEDAPEPPLVSLDPQNPPELPIGHVDRPERVLEGFRPLVDEAIDAMDALAKAVDLSPHEGELFDSVTGILFQMERDLRADKADSQIQCDQCGKAMSVAPEPQCTIDGRILCLDCYRRINEGPPPTRSQSVEKTCNSVQPGEMDDTAAMPEHLRGMVAEERTVWQIGDEAHNCIRELQERARKNNG